MGRTHAADTRDTGAATWRRAPRRARPRGASWTWPRASLSERVVQAVVALVCVGALGLGVALVPSAKGTGTHCQLGLPPCGMLQATGRPCPTCGVTTAFVLAAHGRLVTALVTQPFGLILFFVVVALLVLALVTLAAGRSWFPLLARYDLRAVLLAMLALLLASWAYKWAVT